MNEELLMENMGATTFDVETQLPDIDTEAAIDYMLGDE